MAPNPTSGVYAHLSICPLKIKCSLGMLILAFQKTVETIQGRNLGSKVLTPNFPLWASFHLITGDEKESM